MTKITRKTLKIFAGLASNNGQFGSAQAAAPLVSVDPAVIQQLPAWPVGWNDAVIGGQKLPPLEEFQGVQYVHSYCTAYLFQEGIPEYDSGTTYFQESIVKQPGTYKLYGSLTDNNLGNPVSDGTKWVLLIDLALAANPLPIGTVSPYAGSAAPSLWLLCSGQAVNRTTYAALFAVTGTTYGIGNGTTTFNVPDLRGRVVAGSDNMGGIAANRLTNTTMTPDGDTLGATGGGETHTLTTPEIPPHIHTIKMFSTGTTSPSAGGINYYAEQGDTTDNSGATGGGGAHPNVQPTMVMNQIIYAGV